MSINPVTPAPFSPPDAPSDWTEVVQGNCFTNAQRLGWWLGQTTNLASGDDPSKYIYQLGQFGVGSDMPSFDQATLSFPTVYVLAHGWAPSYRPIVDAAGGNLLWWSPAASVSNRWASDWAWAPVGPLTTPQFQVSTMGMAQSILTYDPTALVLLYSWIDDSATEAGDFSDFMAYRSEAYTHTNGMRLANGLIDVINPLFWQNDGKIHLIGHSHGSRVCTVAAKTLQNLGHAPAQLTILDSPESYMPLGTNGANLLACYLEQMTITDPINGGAGTYVDVYASCFGEGYNPPSTSSTLNNVVEVGLNPGQIYDYGDYGDEHTYAAGWYAGSAAGGSVGMAWPPFPNPNLPALNQNWNGGVVPNNQWSLSLGTNIVGTYAYATSPLTVSGTNYNNVTGDPSTSLIFGPAAYGWSAYSYFEGSFTCDNSDQYGFTFDLDWANPQTGDYFVIVAGDYLSPYTLFVIDGQSAPVGSSSVAVNSDIWGTTGYIWIYFLGSSANSNDTVTLSNFQWVSVTSVDGSLEKAREAAASRREAADPVT